MNKDVKNPKQNTDRFSKPWRKSIYVELISGLRSQLGKYVASWKVRGKSMCLKCSMQEERNMKSVGKVRRSGTCITL